MLHATKNCEVCEFREEKVCVNGKKEHRCLISGNEVGLFETCSNFSKRTGNHIPRIDVNL